MREKQMNTRKISPHCKADKAHQRKKWCANRATFAACLAISTACGVYGASAHAVETSDPKKWVAANLGSLVELYRHLHQSPELSQKEKETSARMANELQELGIKVTTNVGGYGVVGVLANGPGKVLLLRSDMDALPVAERTGVPYASKVRTTDAHGAAVGVMHACGHDVHMANLIGVARYLGSHRDRWSGTIVFVFQPAEETGVGMEAMLNDGLLARFPRPDFAVAMHDSADLATGKISYKPGFALANVDSVDITVKGRGGHGASPESTIDPIVIAARLVLDLQSIVSREIKPIDPAVVTVGSIHGGAKHNVISDECKLQLTLRSFSPEVRQHLQDAVRRKANAAAASSGAPEPKIELSEGTPALYNDPRLTEQVAVALKREFGEKNIELGEAVMGGEDFGRLAKAGVPICMLRLGAVSQKRLDEFAAHHQPPTSLHSPRFYPDINETLTMGVPALAYVAMDLLKPGGKPAAK
jgi:hippurate hydrolase